jgi:hypothetical protein
LPNPNEPGAGAPGRRPRHGQPYRKRRLSGTWRVG